MKEENGERKRENDCGRQKGVRPTCIGDEQIFKRLLEVDFAPKISL